MAEIRSERRLRKIELFGRHCAEKSINSFSGNFNVVVQEQDRLVTEKHIRPKLHQASNGGCFGSRLNNGNIGFRMDVGLLVVVEENVIIARLFKVACVKLWAALDEDKDVAKLLLRFAFDPQSTVGVEAVLTRPQFLPIEGRRHLALGERTVEDPEGRLFERTWLHAARDVADEFEIDIRPRDASPPAIRARENAGTDGDGSGPSPGSARRTRRGRIRRKGRAHSARDAQDRARASLGSRLSRCSRGCGNKSGRRRRSGGSRGSRRSAHNARARIGAGSFAEQAPPRVKARPERSAGLRRSPLNPPAAYSFRRSDGQ